MPDLLVRRSDIADCRMAEDEPRRDDELVVERLALTTNNVSYAVYGDRLGYWRLFPAPEGWGRIPAWGHVLKDGERYFGCVPVGRHVTIRPAPGPVGFVDTSRQDAGLSPVYSFYFPVEDEDEAALVMRPLFGTSVLIDAKLADDGVQSVVLTSASSKTAYGLAHLLHERAVRTLGLTSPERRGWVEDLGLYDEVLGYDELDRVPADAVLVDLAGDRAVSEQLTVARKIAVGFTHGRAPGDAIPGQEFFFAPDEMARRGTEFARAYGTAWRGFAPVAERALRIERISEPDDVLRAWRSLVDGRVDPATAYVVSF